MSARRWTISEEVTIVRMRRENACAKTIARELGRTPQSIGQHVHKMRRRAQIIEHRLEEVALLERLLVEAAMPETYPRERV